MSSEGVVDFGNYSVQLSKELGRGTFGSVYEGFHKRSKTKVAVKKMIIQSDLHGAEGMKEIKLLHKMDSHDNIVKLEDFFYHDTAFWIIMEFCDGDLDGHMENKNPDMDQRIRFMYECASALTHMHEQPSPIIHRDIKPANILIKQIGGRPIVKLTDLGVSKMVDMEEMMKTMMFSTVVGTPGYMAPEQYEKKDYGFPVDCFAMGLVYLALVMYKQGGHLLPLVGSGLMICPVGQDMMMKAAMKQPMPQVVAISRSDSPKMQTVKKVIDSMVRYNARERKKMRDVMNMLAPLVGKSVVDAPAPPTSPLRRLPTPPGSDEEISSDEEEGGTAGGLDLGMDSDIGFALVQAALKEALKERAGGLGAMQMLMQALNDEEKFEMGDKVIVDTDIDRAKRLQAGHGDWIDGMERYLGMQGTVVDSGPGTFRVKFPDGQILTWNGELLQNPSDVGTVRPPYAKPRHLNAMKKFSQYDIVQVTSDKGHFKALQQEIGCWRDDLVDCIEEKGIVTKIDGDGDIVVSLMVGNRAIRCVMHPDLLTKLAPPAQPIESGDVVYIKEDEREVKRLQKGHGGWADGMKEALGKLTMVAATAETKDGKPVAKLEVEGETWHFNVHALVLLVKSEELFQAIIAKAVAEQLAAARPAASVAVPVPPAEKKKKPCVIM